MQVHYIYCSSFNSIDDCYHRVETKENSFYVGDGSSSFTLLKVSTQLPESTVASIVSQVRLLIK